VNARDRILGRLRAAPSTGEPALPDVAGWFGARQRNEDRAQRIARLRAALEGAHAQVHDTNDADWPALLQDIARAKGVHTLLIGSGGAHAEKLAAHATSGVTLVRYTETIDSWRDRLFERIDAGFTAARSAIAETGSLTLAGLIPSSALHGFCYQNTYCLMNGRKGFHWLKNIRRIISLQ